VAQTTVLVVDDEDNVRKGLVTLLEHWGYQCSGAASAEIALDELRAAPRDIVIADIRMPGMDGLQLLRAVKARLPDADFIMITGYDAEYSYLDVVEGGATDFIIKPFAPEELRAKLQRILRERRLRQQLVDLSIRDGLTRLYNRRHFHVKLEEEVVRACRQHRDLTLVMLDVDQLKRINDTRGHVEGDAVLVGVAGVLESMLRHQVDIPFRLGGDEFAAMLIETGSAAGIAAAERIRTAVQQLGDASFTISIGIATLAEGDDGEALLRRADHALYRSKRAGGDAVTALGPDEDQQ
jgi:two-component system, cell cycle response regulator